jgi:hypothetical protein
MKFNVTWQEEKSAVIDTENLGDAESYSVGMCARLGGFPAVKLLSIVPIDKPAEDKPPTPFGRPPSGTLGGGQMKIEETLPDAMAVAA